MCKGMRAEGAEYSHIFNILQVYYIYENGRKKRTDEEEEEKNSTGAKEFSFFYNTLFFLLIPRSAVFICGYNAFYNVVGCVTGRGDGENKAPAVLLYAYNT